MKTIIITRHTTLVEWLSRQGITGKVYEQVVAEREPEHPNEIHLRDLAGAHIIGILPFWIAASGIAYISEVAMPKLPLEARKRMYAGDFTLEEMDAWGASLITYEPPRRLSKQAQHQLLADSFDMS